MIERKPLLTNNGAALKRTQEMAIGVSFAKFPKGQEKASIYHYARAGRQNSEGFGGGRIVGK
jgi:hypothetical protein